MKQPGRFDSKRRERRIKLELGIPIIHHGLRSKVLQILENPLHGVIQLQRQRLNVPTIEFQQVIEEVVVLEIILVHKILVPIG